MQTDPDIDAAPEGAPVARARRGAPPIRPCGPRLLVCGFQEYPGLPVNPAALIASTLARARWTPFAYNIEFVTVPTRWADGLDRIEGHLSREDTRGVLLVNADPDGRGFRIGRSARNALESDREDGAGRRAARATTVDGGADRLAVTAPIAAMQAAVLEEDLSCGLVDSCGGYVCGGALYALLARRPDILAGGLTLPPATGFSAGGVLPLPLMQRGVQAAVTAFAAVIARQGKAGLAEGAERLAG